MYVPVEDTFRALTKGYLGRLILFRQKDKLLTEVKILFLWNFHYLKDIFGWWLEKQIIYNFLTMERKHATSVILYQTFSTPSITF